MNEIQLRIMELGADKTLSFGCIICMDHNGLMDTYLGVSRFNPKLHAVLLEKENLAKNFDQYYIDKCTIVGHPIDLERFLMVLGDDFGYMDGSIVWTDGGGHFREYLCEWEIGKLLEDQDKLVIEDITHLIKDGKLRNNIREQLEFY